MEDEISYLAKRRFFVISPRILNVKLRYIPCWWVSLDYQVTILTKNNIREGSLDFVVDEVKGCAVMEASLPVALAPKTANRKTVMSGTITKSQAEKKAVTDARWKVVMGQYKRPPEIFNVKAARFYRPYYEVDVTYANRPEILWIPADNFGNYYTYQ
jgi:hypothetical protein